MAPKHFLAVASCILASVAWTAAALMGVPADTRIADAAKAGDQAQVTALIKQAVDVNSAQGDGMTALHWAAMNGDAAMVKTLIYAGANVKAATRLGAYTPLFFASQRGHSEVVGILLDAGADPKGAAMDGLTPLIAAAMSGDAASIQLLLRHGADPNATESEHQQSALTFAAAMNRPDAIQILMQNGADPNIATKVLPPAVAKPNPEARPAANAKPAADPKDSKDAPKDKDQAAAQGGGGDGGEKGGHNPRGGLTPLMIAAREGSFEAARKLIEGGADMNRKSGDSSTAVLLSTINGHFDLTQYFVDHNADLNIASVDGMTPLYGVVNIQWARKSMYPQPTTKYEKVFYLDLMKDMLDHGADPNTRLTKDLWYSEYNFNLESASAAGTTAFWKCAEVGDVEGMRLLVSRGADPNLASNDGVTPLLIAAGAGVHGNDDISSPFGRLAGVRYLVEELHADVNATDTGANFDPYKGLDPGKNTSTSAAPANKDKDKAATAQPIQPFSSQDGGYSALHHAAARGDNEMIIYLVAHGAKIDAVSRTGVTAADMANGPRQRIQPYPETVALLEMLGSKNSHKCVSC